MTYDRVLKEFYGLGLTEAQAEEASARFSGCVHSWAYMHLYATERPLFQFHLQRFLLHYFGLMRFVATLDFSQAHDPSLRGFDRPEAWADAFLMPDDAMFDGLRPDVRVSPGRDHPELDCYIAGRRLSPEEWTIGVSLLRGDLAA